MWLLSSNNHNLSTMAVRIMTIFILLISVLFPLLICAPLENQENDVEDSDLYRTAVGGFCYFTIDYFMVI